MRKILYILTIVFFLILGFTVKAETSVPKGVGVPDLNYFTTWTEEEIETMTQAMIDAYIELAETGFNIGDPARTVLVWEGVILQDYRSPDSTGSDPWHGLTLGIVYNPTLKKAFIVKDAFFSAYCFNNPNVTNLGVAGAPVGNEFVFGDYVYQNFENGYYKFNIEDNNDGAFISRRHFDPETGKEVYLTGIPANVGNTSGLMTLPIGFTAQELREKFREVYVEIVESGFNLGTPASSVKLWENVWVQDFADTDSTANPWGDGRGAVLAVDSVMGEVYLVKDDFFRLYAGLTLEGESKPTTIGVVGEPTGFDFEVDGVKYQNFSKGYVKIENDKISFIPNKKVDSNGNETDMYNLESIGQMSKIVEDSLPEGLTKDNVRQALLDKHEELENDNLLPIGLVNVRGNYAYQDFFDAIEKEATTIFVLLKDDNVTANTLSGHMLSVYEKLPNTSYTISGHRVFGAPIGNEFTIDNKTIQQFEYGYLSIDQDGKIVDLRVGFTIDEEGNESDINGIDLIILSPTFEFPKNYKDSEGNVLEEEYYVTKFKEAYKKLVDSGFNPGIPSDEGINIWTPGLENGELHEGMIKLSLKGGDSRGFVFDSNAMLTYNPETEEVILVHDYIYSSFPTIYYKAGYATGEMIEIEDGWLVQQFKNGYVKVSDDGESYKFFEGSVYNPVDDEDQGNQEETEEEKPRDKTPIIVIAAITGGLLIVGGGLVYFKKFK